MKKSIKVVIIIFVVLILIVGFSYALWTYTFTGNNNLIKKDAIEIEYFESSEVIKLVNAVPISDQQGMNQSESFGFQVKTKTKESISIEYSINIEKLELEEGYRTFNDDEIKVYLTDYDNNVLVEPTLISDLENYKLFKKYHIHNKDNGEIKTKYKLKFWIDNNVTGEGWDENTKIAYSFKLDIEATGIKGTPPGEKFNEVILANEEDSLNTGDGLYRYNSKYYYSGVDVNNYVEFNEEIWRIVSIEEDGGVRIIKDTPVELSKISQYELGSPFWTNYLSVHLKDQIINTGKIPFDIKGKRPLDKTLSNSYCISTNNGCNAYDIGTYYGLVVDDESIMKYYLENIYFENMTSLAKTQVQNYTLNIGAVETNKNIDIVLSSEQLYTTTSFIGLLNVSDYVYATRDTTCRSSFDKEGCATSNWLYLANHQYHLLNGKKSGANAQIWTVSDTGVITSRDANNNFSLRPIVVLNKNIKAIGTGKQSDKYILGKILN